MVLDHAASASNELAMSMSGHMHRILGKAIVSGQYDVTPLPSESEIAARFGASRTVVREAVKMLVAKGLISPRQRQGTRVTPMSEWNLLDPEVSVWLKARPFSKQLCLEFIQMRLGIEPVAAALAAESGNANDVAAIAHQVALMKANRNDASKLLEADVDFHVAILRASGNHLFWRMKEFITTALHLSIQASQFVDGIDIKMHEDLYLAIVTGRSQDAEDQARGLLKNAMSLVKLHDETVEK